ncbi:uncharacterized protein isoform X1 [Leptinotarsa decemlineata]|uniref:uncharacterized protein isoform X1 n=1 Tax=Leptinotarsa decemlineata TaxID=7539 RepID=UPI003D30BB5D
MNRLQVSLFIVAALLVAGIQSLSISQDETSPQGVTNGNEELSRKKQCVCMNWRNCAGEIDSDVECHPNYVMVCCIQPDPEPVPFYNGTSDQDTPQPFEDEIKVILVT